MMSPAAADSAAIVAPKRIEFEDPHAGISNLQEAEVTRVRTLRGAWRWALIVATAATILLCINQQFSLRFFIGYTQLNTEYFYLLIALMLPFTFLIFPGSEQSPLDRIPWYDILLFVLTFGSAIVLMRSVRKAAEAGWEFGGAPATVIIAGLVMWVVLMEALRRTGGWSLLLSVLPFTVYPLFADAKWLGPFRGTESTLEQATSYHVLSGESLLGIPIQAFADTVIGFLVFGTALMMSAAGDGRDRIRDRAVPQHQLRRRRGRRDHPGCAVLCRPVHAGGFLCRAPRAEGHSARRAAEDLGHHQGGMVLHLRHRAFDRDAAVLQARESRAVLCNCAALGVKPAFLEGHALDAYDHQQVPRGQRPHLRRAGRHSRRLRPLDRRVLDDRRGLQPRQRPV